MFCPCAGRLCFHSEQSANEADTKKSTLSASVIVSTFVALFCCLGQTATSANSGMRVQSWSSIVNLLHVVLILVFNYTLRNVLN